MVRWHMNAQGKRGWRWALRDVTFQAQPGEAIGLVGINGSGKTTLLKILTRVMYPNAGRLEMPGRVGALLELRAGIHPELTGRENAYLMGSLLGMRRKDVARRLDDIIAFAEIETAIDRQVKFYSSGMWLRLGFAVAAYLEPNVLLVDEVLAVGDAAFQQRCLDRMREILGQGTTLIFVSHDLAAVESICRRGIWLDDGQIRVDGTVSDAVGAFRRAIEEMAEQPMNGQSNGLMHVERLRISADGSTAIRSQGPLDIQALVKSTRTLDGSLLVGVSEGTAMPIFALNRAMTFPAGETQVRCALPFLPLPKGNFFVWLGIFDRGGHDLVKWHPAGRFEVAGPAADQPPAGIVRLAPVHVDATWTVNQEGNGA